MAFCDFLVLLGLPLLLSPSSFSQLSPQVGGSLGVWGGIAPQAAKSLIVKGIVHIGLADDIKTKPQLIFISYTDGGTLMV